MRKFSNLNLLGHMILDLNNIHDILFVSKVVSNEPAPSVCVAGICALNEPLFYFR